MLFMLSITKLQAILPLILDMMSAFFLFDIRRLLKFYYENKPKRNNFNFRYVLYYLLKRKHYPVTLEDFPEIRGSSATEKLCNDFFTRNCT